MKKKAMKSFSLLLVIVMLLSIFPGTSFSAKLSEPKSVVIDAEQLEAVVVAGYGPNSKFLAPIEAQSPSATPISNAAQLNAIRTTGLNGNYVLTANINLSSYGQWTPIGDRNNPFTGTFDGQGHVITGLTITGSSYEYVGLFGYANGANIRNVGMEGTNIGVSFTSSDKGILAGGICGFFYNYGSSQGSIINCYNTGTISVSLSNSWGSTGAYVGGITGGCKLISHCYNAGDIYVSLDASTGSVQTYTGGICGDGYLIDYCDNSGKVSAHAFAGESAYYTLAYAGGICGHDSSSISSCHNSGIIEAYSRSFARNVESASGGICSIASCPINNCYNTGTVYSEGWSDNSAGGICAWADSYGVITNCYNSGDVTATYGKGNVGGICAYIEGSSSRTGKINNCVVLSQEIRGANGYNRYLIGYATGNIDKHNNLALTGISGNANDDSNGRINSTQATTQSTYTNLGWNTSTVWQVISGNYPQLRDPFPATPTLSLTLNPNGSVTASWNSVTGATGYELSWANNSSFAGASAWTTASMSYTVSGLSSGTTYYFWVRAYNEVGYSDYSSGKNITTPSPPTTPAAPTVSNITQNSARLSWNTVSGATLYYLYRDGVEITNTLNTSYTDNTLSPNNTYSYTLRAYNTAGYSAYSPACSVTTLPDTYIITFNTMGGYPTPDPQTKTHGVNLTLSSTKPSKTGYDFKGWDSSSEANIVQYQPEDIYSDNASATLYAVWQAISNNAKLKSLSINLVPLNETFNPDKLEYTATVPYDTSNIIISAETEDTVAKILSGTGTENLPEGINSFLFPVIVMAEDNTTLIYRIMITRADPPGKEARLKSLSISTEEGIIPLNETFDSDITSYTASVTYEVSSMKISAETIDPKAKAEGLGLKNLEVGPNPFIIEVTAEDGKAKETYHVVITRIEQEEPKLKSLEVSTGELTPSFDPDVFEYEVSIDNSVTGITITAVANYPNASIFLKLEELSSGSGIGELTKTIDLDPAKKRFEFEISVVVPGDGEVKIYTIVVTRIPIEPVYKKEDTGEIGTIGRVLCEIPADSASLDKGTLDSEGDDLFDDFLKNYALVCDEDMDIEIYFSPKRTENAIAAGQNTYVFAVRLPNGETREDIKFSFKPIGGDVEQNKIIIYGDVNENGSITTTDATLVTRWAGGNTAAVLRNILAADVNGDAYITTTDATLITRRAGGNPATVFSIETRY